MPWTRRPEDSFSSCSQSCGALCLPMPDDKLVPADPSDLAAALAFALRYAGRKRVR